MEPQYAFLGLLAREPNYGYELKKLYDQYFAADKPILPGQVYATLSRLARDEKIIEIPESEPSSGPPRTRYAITHNGKNALTTWLETPVVPSPNLQVMLYFKTVLALLTAGEASTYIRLQRKAHIARMRELTARKLHAAVAEKLLIDHAIFHIEADLRWMELTSARLINLKEELWKH